MSTNLDIANEIARQIGNRAFFMMGTRSKLADVNCLIFDVRGSRKCTRVRVTLNGKDLYDVASFKMKGSFRAGNLRCEKVAESTDIYCDSLHDVIASQTGLALSL